RTIRELVFNVLMWGALGSWLYFGVFGGYTMHLQLTGKVDLVTILEQSEPARWHRLLWGILLSALAISLTIAGGLSVVQTSSVLVPVPILIMYILLPISLVRWLRQN
uniref:BCCT family transporter n=1 Tax=Virgibacillus salexigens TaxID=61016 RepID=UPI0030812B14